MPQRAFDENERRNLQEEMFRLEEQRDKAEERYQYLFHNALIGLFSMDADTGRMEEVNKAVYALFMVESLEQLNRMSMHSRLMKSLRQNVIQSSSPQGITFTLKMHRSNREPFWAQVSARYQEEQKTIEGVINDVTEQIEARRQIDRAMEEARKARLEAEHANHAKSMFLANMSHEIRTPLNGIIGFSEVIENSDNLEQNRNLSSKVLKESEKLMTLINQLLDLSKIEADKVVLDKRNFSLSQLLDSVIDPFLLPLNQKGLAFKLEVDKNLRNYYKGDAFRLGQIFRNLLSNAVKFTSEGSISLSLTLEKTQDSQDQLFVSVKDTGVGIPETKQNLIFQQFTQADNSIERKFGGTGLGVTICRDLVELMGGELWLESRDGKGSNFCFRLPLTHGVQPETITRGEGEEDPFKIFQSRKILLAEDYLTNREVVSLHLSDLQVELVCAENGKEALDKCRKGIFDLILMDVHMPEMNGLDATREIKKLPGYAGIPIIAMTASAFEEDREACLDAGMEGFLPKPIRKKSLLDQLSIQLRESSALKLQSQVQAQETAPQEIPSEFTLEELAEELGDEEIAREVIEGYLQSGKGLIQTIKKALLEGDREKAHRDSHSLKGGALNIFAHTLAKEALGLEKALVEDIPPDWDSLYNPLEKAFRNLQSEYQRM